MGITFQITKKSGLARRGILNTERGSIQTPAFMPVGTAATIKGLLPDQVHNTGADIILANTYHLMLRPGVENIKKFAGLHQFMSWKHPILTDSGGFQIMSLSSLRDIDEDGVTFKAHTDGSKHRLTPEHAIYLQESFDSDISMVLDECTAYPCTYERAEESMNLSMRWALKSRDAFKERPGKAIFGIIQGGMFNDLRAESIEYLSKMQFDGLAIGGLAVGEGQELMLSVLNNISSLLPTKLPHYLMGVGTPDDIVKSVAMGIDMFDCVLPTRSGRTGRVYILNGHINIKNASYKDDMRPIQEDCRCDTCSNFSRSYINHLFRCREMLGPILCSIHNLYFYQMLMNQIRLSIEEGSYDKFVKNWKNNCISQPAG